MEKEYDAGVAYLKALKQPATSATGTQTQDHPTTPGPTSGSRFHGPEKRRSLRYQCEGSIEMREDGSEAHTWAIFTDVSLHGCYVEAQSIYPKGTTLHMKLEANGVRLEIQGNVRVSYPLLGMGIAFVEGSAENQAALREMMMKAPRPSAITGPGIASTLPAPKLLEAVPPIANPTAAMLALIEFFENRQMLMREDFLRILRNSQGARSE